MGICVRVKKLWATSSSVSLGLCVGESELWSLCYSVFLKLLIKISRTVDLNLYEHWLSGPG